MENSSYVILKSARDKLQKAAFLEDHKEKYYTVVFFIEEENEYIICVSSQIGCCEKCLFCATGDQQFVRNLTSDEIFFELQTGMQMVKDMEPDPGGKTVSVIFEGMGEISYNADNCFLAFDRIYPELSDMFSGITIRISSVGTKQFCTKYREYFEQRKDLYKDVTFEVKLSLHTPYDSERQYLMPCSGSKYRISEILDAFGDLASCFGTKLICNYVLFSYPDGRNNYSLQHAIDLAGLINKDTMRIMLGRYSETGKGFVSPGPKEYRMFYFYLQNVHDIETTVLRLLGQDVNAACGMLNYQE